MKSATPGVRRPRRAAQGTEPSWIQTVSFLLVLLLSPLAAVAETHVVHIRDHTAEQSMVFMPFYLRVNVGDTVEFVSDSIGHVTQSVFVPPGASEWRGEVGERVSTVLDREGVYIYECIFHGRLGMAGVIQAGEATNLEQLRIFYADYKDKFVVYRDRLDPIIEALR